MQTKVITNEIKRQRIMNQYKDFYSLYYEAVERQQVKSKNANTASTLTHLPINRKLRERDQTGRAPVRTLIT